MPIQMAGFEQVSLSPCQLVPLLLVNDWTLMQMYCLYPAVNLSPVINEPVYLWNAPLRCF